MKSGKIGARDYSYLFISLIVPVLLIIGQSVYITVLDSCYESSLDKAIAGKNDIEKVELLLNWPFDELSGIQRTEANYSLGASLYNLDRLDESELYLSKVLELSPSSIGEYFLESQTYDDLHVEASLLLAEIALEKKDFARVELLIDKVLRDDHFSGWCGTMYLIKHNRIYRLRMDLALAVKDEYQVLNMIGEKLIFPNSNDSVRIQKLVNLIQINHSGEVIKNELNDLVENLQEVRIVDDDLTELELYEYSSIFFGVKLIVCSEYGFTYEVQKEFDKFCEDDLLDSKLSDCTISFLKYQIQDSYFYQELMK